MMRVAAVVVACAALFGPQAVAAQRALPATPHTVWTAWSIEPAVLIALGLVVALWARAAACRPARDTHAAAAAFAAVAAAMVTPLAAAAEALLAAHATQHLLLVVVAAPLLVRADVPRVLASALLPRASRRGLARMLRATGIQGGWRRLCQPLPAWVLHAAVLWLWHLPVPYEAALRSGVLQRIEHATLLGTAMLFWLPVLDPSPRRRMSGGAAILYLFTFGVQASLLGALLALADRTWYHGHMPWVATWGLTRLEDQRIAGSILCVPGGAVYLLAVARVFVAWLARLEERAPATAAEGAR